MPFDPHQTSRPTLCASGLIEPDGKAAPRVVNIVPLPVGATSAVIEARDGRRFVVEDAAALVAASNAELARQRGPHPVDKDHQMFSWWRPGGPALGWATQYELRSDGIYAHVEWLAEGERLIGERLYRYTSCNVFCEKQNVQREVDDWGWVVETYDHLMRRLAGFTITNIPALEVYSMAAQEHTRMSMQQQILVRLGLSETAGPSDVLAAIERLSAAPSLDKFVPRADYDAAIEKLATAEARAVELERAAAKSEHDALIADALKSGKITPATVSYHRENLALPGGVERFKRFAAAAPEIAGQVELKKIDGEDSNSLSPTELHACRIAGMTPEAYVAERAARRKAKRTT